MTDSTTTTSHATQRSPNIHEADYAATLATIRDCAHDLGASAKHAFTTDAAELWPAFLAALPADQRQHHTCTACRHFVERFGSLVVVSEDGILMSLLWSHGGHGIYGPAVQAMSRIVARAKITGALVTTAALWGEPVTGPWHHFAVEADGLCPSLVAKPSAVETASQRAAKIRHEHGLLCAALAEYPADTVAKALAMLETGKMYRSEACLGVARWLHGIHEARARVKNAKIVDNLMWTHAAAAPAGWCHVKSGMIGTLLDDVASGLSFDDVAARFKAKMDPLQYLRPTAPVSTGNIAQAEKIVDAMGLRPSLERRFAKLEDIAEALWKPQPPAKPADAGGAFGHLLASRPGPADIGAPSVVMTWAKFAATVLPAAEHIEVDAPSVGSYIALVTAVHPDAPPILQWDREDQRNPVSWYLYAGGSLVERWGLRRGWNDVTAICLAPSNWHGRGRGKDGLRVFAMLKGAMDQGDGGLGLFPEILRSELHQVRNTIEAHSNRSLLSGREDATACGIEISSWCLTLRVTHRDLRQTYRIDRWD